MNQKYTLDNIYFFVCKSYINFHFSDSPFSFSWCPRWSVSRTLWCPSGLQLPWLKKIIVVESVEKQFLWGILLKYFFSLFFQLFFHFLQIRDVFLFYFGNPLPHTCAISIPSEVHVRIQSTRMVQLPSCFAAATESMYTTLFSTVSPLKWEKQRQ